MKKTTLLLAALFLGLSTYTAQAQGFAQLGTIFLEDNGHRLLFTSDGGYITAGLAGQQAVLYKTDCQGNIVASISKTVLPGPAAFWDVVELPDGHLVAVGGATVATPTDTATHVFLLKTTANLGEVASNHFLILDKEAQGKSLAVTASGQLLVWGEVTGVSIDFTDAFFQRVSANTLQPTANPVIFNNGVDLASRILPTADGQFLLAGSSFFGNIFNPDADINNILRAYKVDENGTLIWEANVSQTFLAKYGVSQSCGVAQNLATGNFMLGGMLYGGTDDLKHDLFFALINNNGTVLDTSFASGAGKQKGFAIVAHKDNPGLFTIGGESDGSPLGVPSIALAQSYELNNEIFVSGLITDPNTPISIHDLWEIDPGRFAYIGTLPDNPTFLGATDIVVSTPSATVDMVFQNCALAATFSIPAVAYQWLYEGQVIPGANQGAYFPTQPGLYAVQILDDKGCFGVSDTFRVDAPVADFTFLENNLTVNFSNTSVDATLYQWTFGDGGTSNQANPSHTYSANGVYTVTLIAKTACGFADTLSQHVGVVSAEEPSWLEHFSLSPNPTTGSVSIALGGEPQENMEFALFGALGQLVLREVAGFQSGFLQKNLDLRHLPAGVYSLRIQSGKEAKNVRLVKQ